MSPFFCPLLSASCQISFLDAALVQVIVSLGTTSDELAQSILLAS
jgi:hypothetical protein